MHWTMIKLVEMPQIHTHSIRFSTSIYASIDYEVLRALKIVWLMWNYFTLHNHGLKLSDTEISEWIPSHLSHTEISEWIQSHLSHTEISEWIPSDLSHTEISIQYWEL